MRIPQTCLSLMLVTTLSGCLLESVRPVDRNLKPYGAHWIKEGMTRESRKLDLTSCGALAGEEVRSPPERISAERQKTEPNEIAAYLRLRSKVGSCMQAKGYKPIGDLYFLGGCDERCLYP